MTDKTRKLRDAAAAEISDCHSCGNTGWFEEGDGVAAGIPCTCKELRDAISDFDAQPSPQPDSLLKELDEIEAVIETYDPQTQAQLIQIAGQRLLSLLRERMGHHG